MAKQKIIAGLDIGSNTIKMLVVQQGNEELNFETIAAIEEPSAGIRKGIVINPAEVSTVLEKILNNIEEQIGKKINSVYVNINGSHIFSTLSQGLISVSRADQKISQEDIERVLQASQTISLPLNREIIEIFPQEFIIDGEKGIKEPLGLHGIRLEVNALVLVGFSPYIKNLTTAVLNAGLQINDLIFSPLASAEAVLSNKEKELGVILIDIGAGTTSFVVFEEGNLIFTGILPIGSNHITNDIAIFLKSDIEVAEKVKQEFGTALFQGNDKKEKIKINEEEIINFSLKQLSKIIEDRVMEIFEEINKELKKIQKQNLLPAGIVLTGGGAKLPKIRELAKKKFKLPCRLARPKKILSLPDDFKFNVAAGLILSGKEEDLKNRKSFSLFKQIGSKIKKIFKIFIP